MKKVLVAYFSVSGTTAKAAKNLAAAEGADLFEIRPETPYVPDDLDYTNKQSRTTLEMTDPSCRPATVGKVESGLLPVLYVENPGLSGLDGLIYIASFRIK